MPEPYYQDDLVTLHEGKAVDVAASLTPGSVRTIVTSPPYFGLRDYGHDDQTGAEASVGEYVESLVATFAALRPALADDGTLWLNLGDSYATRWGSQRSSGRAGMGDHLRERLSTAGAIPEKNLLGVPWRVAFALQADGWILRSDIIWAKPNPMPESVTDRPTKAHEYLFLFAKQPKYYYDAEAIQEDANPAYESRYASGFGGAKNEALAATKFGQTKPVGDRAFTGKRNKRTVWDVATTPFPGAHFATYPPALIRPCILAGSQGAGLRCDCDEIINTPTGSGDRPDDPSQTVGRAGMSRPRGDGEGRRPITRRIQRGHAEQLRLSPHRAEMERDAGDAFSHYIRTDRAGARPVPPDLLQDWTGRGWITSVPPCEHPVMPADTVLDPFSGSGTTGMVATQEGRRYVGIDVNAEYLDLSLRTRFAEPVLDLTGGVA